MLNIRSGDSYITTFKSQGWDTMGEAEVVVDISAGPMLFTMEERLLKAEAAIIAIESENLTNSTLRLNNPALQDLYEKYQVMLCLLKDHNAAELG